MQKFSLMRSCFSLLEVKATGDQMKCTITLKKKNYRFLKGVVIFLVVSYIKLFWITASQTFFFSCHHHVRYFFTCLHLFVVWFVRRITKKLLNKLDDGSSSGIDPINL